MPALKLIIFDLDGTLVDAYPAITASFNRTMKAFGYPRQKASIIRRAVGWGDENLLRPFVEEAHVAPALSFYRRCHRVDLLKNSRVIGGAYAVLGALRTKGYKLAVATNRPQRFTWIIIRHLKLDRSLDYVVCADQLKNIKPHPEILIKIMHKFRAWRHQTVFVGDMRIDAQTARNAGVRGVMVTSGSHTKAELARERPWRIIRSIKTLPAVLE